MNALAVVVCGAGAMFTALDGDYTCGVFVALLCVFVAKGWR
jgi:type IV secretory pathway VirB2 component (pilin)